MVLPKQPQLGVLELFCIIKNEQLKGNTYARKGVVKGSNLHLDRQCAP